MANTPGRSRKLRYRFAAPASLVLAVVAGLIGFAPAAFAHHPIVVGTSSVGGFSVTKRVTGQTTGYVEGSTFAVSYTCSDGTEGSVTLARDETKAVGGLPLGTSCTLAETSKPATADGSYAYTAESWTPSNRVSITEADQVVAVTLTNPIRRVLGGFSVTKKVTGETDGYVPDSRFTIAYDCGGGVSGALQIIDGETAEVGSFPRGTVCHLAEIAKPAPSDASYRYGSESWDPSDTVTITDEDRVAAVVLTNPIERVLGSFTVTEKVTGETAGYVPGSTFTVGYECGGDVTGTLTLADGETETVGPLPIGDTCRLTEGDQARHDRPRLPLGAGVVRAVGLGDHRRQRRTTTPCRWCSPTPSSGSSAGSR